jgi:uncharacterized protein (DUF983 family)
MTTESANPGMPESADQLLIEFLRHRDVKCPRCGYNLRGLAVPRCPECGGEITLAIANPAAASAARIVLMIASCMSTGMGAMLVTVIIRIEPLRQFWLPFESFSTINLVLLLLFLGLPALILAIWQRRRFEQLPPRLQWLCATAMVSLVATIQISLFLIH